MDKINKGFALKEKGGVCFLTIPSFEKAGGVCCAFSTRIGGISPKPYDTMNFSRKREQNEASFKENLARFAEAAGFDSARAACINYAHGAELYCIEENDVGCGIVRQALPQMCDGLYTDVAGLPLITFHADCVPLFFYDPKRRAGCVCHAGWRGVAAHMTRNAVEALISIGCKEEDILAAIGPCISEKHFEVGQDVGTIFINAFGSDTVAQRKNRLFVDLNKACIIDMIGAGIQPAHITDAALCTYGDERLFFSHRRDNGRTGAMAAVIAIK